MGESRERGGHLQRWHGLSQATEASGEWFNAQVGADEDDGAITPAMVPLEPMIVVDASGDESDPQFGARPRVETEPPPSVLTVEELATLLRVERKTVYAAISRGEIPGVRRVGSLLRVSRDRVLDWLAQGQDRISRSRKTQ
jgi:excisionase family DNA binding protein